MSRLVYHITHVKNLAGMIQNGIHCDRDMQSQAGHVSIGYSHIKERRMQRDVPVAAQGTLGDYVPFYFGPRSPMLFTIHQGNNDNYQEGQTPIVHLVLDIQTLAQLGHPFCFTDRHAELGQAIYSEHLAEIDDYVDWSIMEGKYWHNIESYPDRKERRQAEFLVHKNVPFTAVHSIGVINQNMHDQVTRILRASNVNQMVDIKPNWYYT